MSNGLLDIMVRSKNAMEAFEASLRIHTNNSANISTSGYKAITHSFKTVFNEVMSTGYQAQNGGSGANPTQFGSGVTLANIKLDFSQGDLGEGGPLDGAVAGRGLFMVTGSQGDESRYLYTRDGEFKVDPSGQYIVDSSGRKLIGYSSGSGGALAPLLTQGYQDLGWKDGGVLVATGLGEPRPAARAPAPS